MFPILYYGEESWAKATQKKLDAFEIWLYTKILKIAWVDKVINEIVVERMRKEKGVTNTIKRRKLEYLGHTMKNYTKYRILKCTPNEKCLGRGDLEEESEDNDCDHVITNLVSKQFSLYIPTSRGSSEKNTVCPHPEKITR